MPQTAKDATELSPEELRWLCPEECLTFETTEGVAPVEGTIGQDRAMRALRIGLELWRPGYNVFVSGLTGTGRSSTVKEILCGMAPVRPVPKDRAYVMNFSDPDKPRLLTFEPGWATHFRRAMEDFVRHLRSRLPAVFESKEVADQQEEIVKKYGEKEQEILSGFQERLKKEGLALVSVQVGPVPRPDIFPTFEGEPVPPPKLAELVKEGKLTEEQVAAMEAEIEKYQKELREHLRRGRDLAREMNREVEKMRKTVGLTVIEGELEDLRDRFRDNEAVRIFLDEVQEDVLEKLGMLASTSDSGEAAPQAEAHYHLYEVNVIADHSGERGCPVVVAQNPTHLALFGTIDREMAGPGVWRSDHTMIKAGALLEADGGYLIINVLDALLQPGVWPVLMQTLKSGRLEIRLPEMLPLLGVTSALKPEPIDLDVKVVLIGEPHLYFLLYAHDPDFKKIFKVKADFTPDMALRDENLEHYVKVIARICEDEDLLPLSREAMGRLAEAGVRAAGRQDRITTRFAKVADVVREADYWCRHDGGEVIGREHVEKAIAERRYRVSEIDSRLQELMEKDILIIRTDGTAVGQVNGLSVMSLGYTSFGKPTLITASTAVGRAGIINIEREARLSGGIYDKGVLIIAGYLRRLFGRKRPMALTASLSFEQSYAGVDGDSASLAEIAALCSDLSGFPVDQGIAVTGSVNQRGEIQPVGGVNEKIEGFFRLCEVRGLTGSQGVVLPRRNVADLMLHEEVVEAVKAGRFHIFGVSSVEQVLEILTGSPAGDRGEDDEYPEGTVFHAVDERLKAYYDALKGREEQDWRPLQELPAGKPQAAEPTPELPPRPTTGPEEDETVEPGG